MSIRTENPEELAKKVQARLQESPEIRPFPAAVSRLLSACKDIDASARTFEPIIESDPALSIQVLRIANSPLFGLPKVNSIAHAVALLGLNKLRTLAMSIAGASMFSEGRVAKVQRQWIWNHSVGCAIVARLLAEHNSTVTSEDAFLGGIFHDVGKLFFFDVVPDEYSALADSTTGAALVEEEKSLFGTSHEEIGLKSAHSWQLSKEIKAAIGWHHRPEQAPVHRDVAASIFFADALAKSWGIGPANASSNVRNDVLTEYNLTEGELDKLQERARQEFDETMNAWAC